MEAGSLSNIRIRIFSFDYDRGIEMTATEPILKLFGMTENNESICLHLHQIYSYFYIDYDGPIDQISSAMHYVSLLGSELFSLVKQYYPKIYNTNSDNIPFRILLVKGIPIYGFHDDYKLYLKILIYPYGMSHFNPSHQFMIDYNLFGMDWIELSYMKIRDPIEKTSHSDIEGDTWPEYIMNRKLYRKKYPARNDTALGLYPKHYRTVESLDNIEKELRLRMKLERSKPQQIPIKINQDHTNASFKGQVFNAAISVFEAIDITIFDSDANHPIGLFNASQINFNSHNDEMIPPTISKDLDLDSLIRTQDTDELHSDSIEPTEELFIPPLLAPTDDELGSVKAVHPLSDVKTIDGIEGENPSSQTSMTSFINDQDLLALTPNKLQVDFSNSPTQISPPPIDSIHKYLELSSNIFVVYKVLPPSLSYLLEHNDLLYEYTSEPMLQTKRQVVLSENLSSWMSVPFFLSQETALQWIETANKCDHSFEVLIKSENEKSTFLFSPYANINPSFLKIMVIELLTGNQRASLLPDPKIDAIQTIFYAIYHDIYEESNLNGWIYGIIILDDFDLRQKTKNISKMFDDILVTLTENELIDAFIDLVHMHDPDIICSYEIDSLSLGYMIERLFCLKRHPYLCMELGRMKFVEKKKLHVYDSVPEFNSLTPYQDSANWLNSSESIITRIPGRVVLDLWRIIRSELNMRSHTLENSVFEVLRSRIPKFSNETLHDWMTSGSGVLVTRCLNYFLNKLRLSLEILLSMDFFSRTCEFAKLYGIEFETVLTRGSQYRVESYLARAAKLDNYVLYSPSSQQVREMKAVECLPLVMEPLANFYHDPIIVLDFQSLYPSIIIAYNYCFSTCLGRVDEKAVVMTDVVDKELGAGSLSFNHLDLIRKYGSAYYNVTPNHCMFIRKDIREGVLPKMLSEILNLRVSLKHEMKQSQNESQAVKLMESRQEALKYISNVTYGYTAASFSGRMPCAEIADAIVETGRRTLENAIYLINTTEHWKARVVYGDTDSVFVQVKGFDRKRAFEIGAEIANAVTAANPYPVKLRFEKVYHPCFLITKKRYVGNKFDKEAAIESTFDAKGIETVRKDSCPLTANIMEKCIRNFFEHQDELVLEKFLLRKLQNIFEGQERFEQFIFSRELHRSSCHPDLKDILSPSAFIARRRYILDYRDRVWFGDRVPFVVTLPNKHSTKLLDRISSVREYWKTPSAKLDYTHYILKHIAPVLSRVFKHCSLDIASICRRAIRLYGSSKLKLRSSINICSTSRWKEGEKILNDEVVLSVNRLCTYCSNGNVAVEKSECISLDCPVFYIRQTLNYLFE